MTFGSLFSGIGGLDLGLERAGMVCKWQVEIDSYCRAVLEKHWPGVPRWDDATTFPPDADWSSTGKRGERASVSASHSRRVHDRGRSCNDTRQVSVGSAGQDSRWSVDLICGGFPCQPVSVAGRRGGTSDARWLWPEFARILGILRPRYALVENVPGLLAANGGGAMSAVLGDLASLGYDAEWTSIPAAAVGAPHLRYRVFIVAYAQGITGQVRGAEGERLGGFAGSGEDVAYTDSERRDGRSWVFRSGRGREPADCGFWAVEPDVGRVAHGIPARVDRLRALGNAVVPQVAEWVGKQILKAEDVTGASIHAVAAGKKMPC